jgi:hypothetical protein
MASKACAESERRIEYATQESLIAENPNCYLVTRSDDTFLIIPF